MLRTARIVVKSILILCFIYETICIINAQWDISNFNSKNRQAYLHAHVSPMIGLAASSVEPAPPVLRTERNDMFQRQG
jgi:hypothetical protein